MQPDDFDSFARVLDAAYSLHSKSLTSDARALFFSALSEYSLADVRKAFSAHIKDPQRGQFPPKPADIISHLIGDALNDGRPDAEEAWAISRGAVDEDETVVWTQECAAAFAKVEHLLLARDDVAARMAFKSAYTRLVEQARAQKIVTHWYASNGRDAARREYVIAQAVRDGKLTLAHAKTIVPAVLEDLREEKAMAEVQKLTSKLTGRLPS